MQLAARISRCQTVFWFLRCWVASASSQLSSSKSNTCSAAATLMISPITRFFAILVDIHRPSLPSTINVPFSGTLAMVAIAAAFMVPLHHAVDILGTLEINFVCARIETTKTLRTTLSCEMLVDHQNDAIVDIYLLHYTLIWKLVYISSNYRLFGRWDGMFPGF